jgi:hypothetical protein
MTFLIVAKVASVPISVESLEVSAFVALLDDANCEFRLSVAADALPILEVADVVLFMIRFKA